MRSCDLQAGRLNVAGFEWVTCHTHEGGVDYQVDWQLSSLVECFQVSADHRRDSLDEYDEYIAMAGGVHAIEPEIWPC